MARRHSGIFTKDEARAAGVRDNTIAARLRTGLWVPEYGRAIRAATTPSTMDGRERAALVRVGSPAALSHLSAARRWHLGAPQPGLVWITVPAARNPRGAEGLRIVRSRHMSDDLVRLVDGVPVLEPARTIADLALLLDQRELTAVTLAAMQRQLCALDDVRKWQQILAGRPGSSTLRRVVEEADPAFESILAAEFGGLMTGVGIALVAGYPLRLGDGGLVMCDFADPATRIDFEIDGFAYHSSPQQVARDKARDRRLLRVGWVTVRYDTDEIRRRPRRTIEDVRRQQAIRLAPAALPRV